MVVQVTATLVILALFVLAVYWEMRRRNRRKLERLARERELERERARIAQDIHDDLGASLTRSDAKPIRARVNCTIGPRFLRAQPDLQHRPRTHPRHG